MRLHVDDRIEYVIECHRVDPAGRAQEGHWRIAVLRLSAAAVHDPWMSGDASRARASTAHSSRGWARLLREEREEGEVGAVPHEGVRPDAEEEARVAAAVEGAAIEGAAALRAAHVAASVLDRDGEVARRRPERTRTTRTHKLSRRGPADGAFEARSTRIGANSEPPCCRNCSLARMSRMPRQHSSVTPSPSGGS